MPLRVGSKVVFLYVVGINFFDTAEAYNDGGRCQFGGFISSL